MKWNLGPKSCTLCSKTFKSEMMMYYHVMSDYISIYVVYYYYLSKPTPSSPLPIPSRLFEIYEIAKENDQ